MVATIGGLFQDIIKPIFTFNKPDENNLILQEAIKSKYKIEEFKLSIFVKVNLKNENLDSLQSLFNTEIKDFLKLNLKQSKNGLIGSSYEVVNDSMILKSLQIPEKSKFYPSTEKHRDLDYLILNYGIALSILKDDFSSASFVPFSGGYEGSPDLEILFSPEISRLEIDTNVTELTISNLYCKPTSDNWKFNDNVNSLTDLVGATIILYFYDNIYPQTKTQSVISDDFEKIFTLVGGMLHVSNCSLNLLFIKRLEFKRKNIGSIYVMKLPETLDGLLEYCNTNTISKEVFFKDYSKEN